ncbi:MAG: hypothetical protein CM1200mP41_34600 [Gammaproteobacteria bacterium]|nr:MAG: hypothetical protein CM1200mP41_34600 [Gammaproteobacteria bacterium]
MHRYGFITELLPEITQHYLAADVVSRKWISDVGLFGALMIGFAWENH